ncbi:MAG TPA: hypothetical protein VFF65_08800 [Phycisphaerales bacterium]|nr:hypothetical protein [Phycisphaerales bacterium]
MLDVGVESVIAPGRSMVPQWASELAPCPVESRSVILTGGVAASVQHTHGNGVAMVTAVVPGASRLEAEGLRRAAADVFTLVLEGLRESPCPYPVRMWNFVPAIHGRMGEGIDRYRVFNQGRFDAFSRWWAGPSTFSRVLPAASAVGHMGDQLIVCGLGSTQPGLPAENPRQVPAFGYSTAHGPRPPCFARATVARLPAGARLLVSGTASIRGEDSVHSGSLPAQLDETFINIERLLASVTGPRGERFSIDGVESARVYFVRETDRAWLAAAVSARLPATAGIEFFPALVCREELLVEIEAVVVPA